jgi:hypothetical protein
MINLEIKIQEIDEFRDIEINDYIVNKRSFYEIKEKVNELDDLYFCKLQILYKRFECWVRNRYLDTFQYRTYEDYLNDTWFFFENFYIHKQYAKDSNGNYLPLEMNEVMLERWDKLAEELFAEIGAN